jgi:hypothetical protein
MINCSNGRAKRPSARATGAWAEAVGKLSRLDPPHRGGRMNRVRSLRLKRQGLDWAERHGIKDPAQFVRAGMLVDDFYDTVGSQFEDGGRTSGA